jgi:hypothetical protein
MPSVSCVFKIMDVVSAQSTCRIFFTFSIAGGHSTGIELALVKIIVESFGGTFIVLPGRVRDLILSLPLLFLKRLTKKSTNRTAGEIKAKTDGFS